MATSSSRANRGQPLPSERYRDWDWWSAAPESRKKAREEFEKLPKDIQGHMLRTIARYLSGQTRRQDVDHLGDGIYELRERRANNHYRVLFFHWGDVCVALTAFYKNQQKTPLGDIARAAARRKTWKAVRGDEPPVQA